MEKFEMKKYGFVNDVENNSKSMAYSRWASMINRCYNKNSNSYKTYGANGVEICQEWKLFSNFKKWFDDNYIDGYQIDKDYGGGKLYSPTTCNFISRYDNAKESLSRRNYSNIKGEKNSNGVGKDYYSNTPTTRWGFKRSCSRNDWNFNDFEEIFVCKSESRHYKYIYKYIGID